MEKIIYIGIDVSKDFNVAGFLNWEGKRLQKPLQFSNNPSGAERIEKEIVRIANDLKVDKIILGTEATGFFDLHLVDFLAESERLAQLKTEIYRLNPKWVRKFKDSLPDQEKTDLKDCEVIAHKLRNNPGVKPYLSQNKFLPLQRLTRYRVHLANNLVQEKQYFLTLLFLKYSGISQKRPLKRVFGATSRAILSEYLSAEEILETDLEQLTALIIKTSRKKIAFPQELAQEIQRAVRDSYRLKPSLDKSLNLILASVMRNIRALEQSIKEMSKAIEEEFGVFPNTLCSITGMGKILAAGILSEIGDIRRFKSDAALAKFAGLWWPRRQSGKFEAEDRKIRTTGNVYLRYYLVEAANCLKLHNPEYQVFYQRKYQEARDHRHKRALVLSARKLARLVFSLLKRGELYKPAYPFSS